MVTAVLVEVVPRIGKTNIVIIINDNNNNNNNNNNNSNNVIHCWDEPSRAVRI